MEVAVAERRLTLQLGCEFAFETNDNTPAVFVVRPCGSGPHRIVDQQWTSNPHLHYHDYVDLYGNVCRRMTLPPGSTTVRYDARVETPGDIDAVDFNAEQHPIDQLPDDALVYTLPSRFCLSDVLSDRAWQLFGNTPTGWERVQAIVDYTHRSLDFAYGSSYPTTTAVDALEAGRGVCRDYAHLSISFCRAMNIPARYVFGYLPDIDVPPPYAPMDFCAWTEVYLGGRWWTFDPRNNARRRGRVVIARGRDALDVAMVTSYGQAYLRNMLVIADKIEQ
jgi:transglutaminase-like putative cysteine protease